MISISVILIIIVTIMFSLLYYFKNRDRNREVGILKALGLSQKDALKLIGTDMVKNTISTFVFSIVISIVTVFMSGMVSVWRTSKIDVIDAIRLNK